jgi:hypothetical protein
MGALDRVYAHRFDDPDVRAKDRLWIEIGRYLQRHVDPSQPVLDVACDRGNFIRNIRGSERWASDVRDVSAALPPDIHFVQADGLSLADKLPAGRISGPPCSLRRSRSLGLPFRRRPAMSAPSSLPRRRPRELSAWQPSRRWRWR